MAIEVTTLQPATAGFALNATSADASGCEEILAAQGAGKYIILRQVIISCVSAITITIGAGETDGDVTAIILGPLTFTVSSPVFLFTFNPGIRLAANTALVVDASGAGAICLFVQGEVE